MIIRINLSRIDLQHADIFGWEEAEGQLRFPAAYPDHGYWPGMQDATFLSSFIHPLGSLHLEGHSFPAPQPAERYLAEHVYGPDYLLPTRPPATHELRPVVDREDLTPIVKSLLDEAAELERRLYAT